MFVSLLVVIVDQVSKFLIKGLSIPFLKINWPGISLGQRVQVLGSLFNITFIENPGIAFGIYLGHVFKLIICLFSLAASAGLFYYLYKNRNKSFLLRVSVALILGGAVGNMLDRVFYGVIYGYAPLFYGRVVDFFNLKIFNFFAFGKVFGNYVFNVADLSVTVGVVMLLFAVSRKTEKEKEETVVVNGILAENKE